MEAVDNAVDGAVDGGSGWTVAVDGGCGQWLWTVTVDGSCGWWLWTVAVGSRSTRGLAVQLLCFHLD